MMFNYGIREARERIRITMNVTVKEIPAPV
jgi:hypothetical protein